MWPQSVVNLPFLISDSDNHIGRVFVAAEKAGIRQNDLLLALNGRPYRGLADFATLLAASRAGDSIAVTFSSGAVTRTVDVRLQEHVTATRWSLNQIIFVTLGIFVPIFCIGLGFWTVLARPRDHMAWLLLAVLLGFTQILLGPLTERWPGWIYYVSIAYRAFLSGTWPAWMLLFGIYFPEPFPPGRWRTLSKVLMWVLLPPLAINTITSLYIYLAGYHDYQIVAWLENLVSPIEPFIRVAVYLSIGFFTIALAVKYRLAGSTDARRRLALLYVGSFVSLVPAISITLVSVLKGVSPDQLIPPWLLFIALLLVLFFPLTLAYVIVVHRAVDVRVALRQGLQYALASNGVLALRVIASSVVIFAAATLVTDTSRNRSQKIEAIALGFLAIFLFVMALQSCAPGQTVGFSATLTTPNKFSLT